jgi:hypothetical protein
LFAIIQAAGWPIWPLLGWGIGLGCHAAPLLAGVGTRRVPLETNYFEAYNRDNVELVEGETDEFGNAQPAGESQLQHGPIANA